MYQLLKEGPLPNRGEQVLPEFRRIRDALREQVDRIVEYRRLNSKAVMNGHPLVKLLMSLNVPITLDPLLYNDKVRDVALYVARSMRMTTPLGEGQAFSPGVFYGEHVTEVIWAHMDDYDTSLLLTNWRELQPVRVLYHPKTDLRLGLPDGRRPSLEAGMAVIAVNVPMLASQYRMWRAEQQQLNPDFQRTIMQFLMEVPLPNMLRSHLDIALMNRMIGRYFEVEMPEVPSQHPFYLTDWTADVDRMLDRHLHFLSRKALTFDALVSQVPTVFSDDLHDVLRLPDMAAVRQVQWAVVIGRLALTTFLVQFSYQTDNHANRQYLAYLQRYLRQMDMAKTLVSALSRQRYEDIRTLIEEGIEPYLY